MFIPRGKTLYENLATSYVLVDALVDDFCEGGFSGVVEVLLRDTDSHVIIERGKVVAVLQEGGGLASHTTIAALAKKARAERGSISIYVHEIDVVSALADCARSEPLYTRLSTEFANLEKMILKLARERDRQWFIEINTHSGARALVQLKDDRCRIITPDAEMVETGSDVMMSDAAMRRLIDECNLTGATLDVYFKRAVDEPSEGHPQVESGPEPSAQDVPATGAAQAQQPATTDAYAEISPSPYKTNEMGVPAEIDIALSGGAQDSKDSSREDSLLVTPGSDAKARPSRPLEVPEDMLAASLNTSPPSVSSGVTGDLAEDLAIARGEFSAASDPENTREAIVMVDVKRLMCEVARAVEDATREVEQKEIFPMHLRAGQLKVADRYPFLDPFGDEFEYLAGEIAFIGTASPSPFIAGLTEALCLAVDGLINSSSQPARLRARIQQNLRSLLERSRQELEQFGLDDSIERILAR